MHTVAASCCAHLLRGVPVRFAAGTRPRVPAVLVSESTQSLMRDVFAAPALFEGLPSIRRRIVAWGPGAAPVELPHSAVLVSEDELIARLPAAPPAAPNPAADWTIYTARPLPDPAADRHFGARRASALAVDSEPSTCCIESLPGGWLFLVPGWLIAVGAAPAALLAESRLIAPRVTRSAAQPAEFPAYPRIADPLCAPGWLACGSAAMAFDPICGDGTGNAVREAVLASAVVRAALRGEPAGPLLAHYRTRLIAGFRRHLELALQFYRTGGASPWWREEAAALERGAAWCAAQLAAAPPYRYRLEGFELSASTE